MAVWFQSIVVLKRTQLHVLGMRTMSKNYLGYLIIDDRKYRLFYEALEKFLLVKDPESPLSKLLAKWREEDEAERLKQEQLKGTGKEGDQQD